jgi:hypothetical protein
MCAFRLPRLGLRRAARGEAAGLDLEELVKDPLEISWWYPGSLENLDLDEFDIAGRANFDSLLPASEYFAALSRRLNNTCSNGTASRRSNGTGGVMSSSTQCPRGRPAGEACSVLTLATGRG